MLTLSLWKTNGKKNHQSLWIEWWTIQIDCARGLRDIISKSARIIWSLSLFLSLSLSRFIWRLINIISFILSRIIRKWGENGDFSRKNTWLPRTASSTNIPFPLRSHSIRSAPVLESDCKLCNQVTSSCDHHVTWLSNWSSELTCCTGTCCHTTHQRRYLKVNIIFNVWT